MEKLFPLGGGRHLARLQASLYETHDGLVLPLNQKAAALELKDEHEGPPDYQPMTHAHCPCKWLTLGRWGQC